MNLTMRPSRVLKKLRSGGEAYVFKLNVADVRVADLAARYGFDCLWTCAEHLGNDWSAIEGQILAGKAYDTDVLCRVSRGGYSDYIRPLEMDATGIMVPHIMSAEDARTVVHMTRFNPIGRRAMDGGNADGAYCGIAGPEYTRLANEQRFVVLQIEDPEPLEELDEIAAIDGYDILFLGPGDLSHALGDPGNLYLPEIVDARKRIPEICRKYGKFAGTVAGPENRQELTDMGYTFLNMGADVVGLSRYCREMAGACGITQPNLPTSVY